MVSPGTAPLQDTMLYSMFSDALPSSGGVCSKTSECIKLSTVKVWTWLICVFKLTDHLDITLALSQIYILLLFRVTFRRDHFVLRLISNTPTLTSALELFNTQNQFSQPCLYYGWQAPTIFCQSWNLFNCRTWEILKYFLILGAVIWFEVAGMQLEKGGCCAFLWKADSVTCGRSQTSCFLLLLVFILS